MKTDIDGNKINIFQADTTPQAISWPPGKPAQTPIASGMDVAIVEH